MDLPIELVKEFAKTTNDETIINEGTTVYGRYILQNDNAFVEIDGSDGTLTPVATTSTAKNGDRVTVLIKDHTAIVTGNLTDPSASSDKVEEVEKSVSFLDSDLEGVKETIEDLDSTVTDLDSIVDTVNWKYKDAEGNIITLTGKIDDVIKQANNAADDASKVATNYIKFFDGTGLVIGNNIGTVAEANIGFNTMIDSTSFNIRYGETTLASYEARMIKLGISTIYTNYNRMYLASNRPVLIGINATIDPDSELNPSIEIFPRGADSRDEDEIGIYANKIDMGAGVLHVSKIGKNLTVSGDLTVSGNFKATSSDYAPVYHTHSQYYSSGDNIYANKLYVQGAGNISGDPNARLAASSPYQLGYASGSSMWFKHDIKPVENEELDPHHLYDIKVYQFKYNDDYLNENDQRYGVDCIGFIAEQVNNVYPIAADRETGKPRNWEMRYIIPPMLALIQEHKKEIDALKAKIIELENKEVS